MDRRANLNTNRLVWMDVAKGIAIILMVAGHTTIPKYISDFIWSFHMPLFFIASGWLTNWDKTDWKKYILRKGRNLLIPFLSYSIIDLFLFLFLLPNKGVSLISVLSKGWEGIALWFIPVLFFSLIIAKKIIDINNGKIVIFIAICLALLGSFLNYFNIVLPWAFASIPFATSLVIIGKYASQGIKLLMQHSCILMVMGCVFTLIISHFFRLDMACNQVFPVSFTIIGAISGTTMIFSFSLLISKKASAISNVLAKVGRDTMMILALSQIIIIMLKEFTDFGSLARYCLLIIILFVFKYIKDYINNYITFKLF